MKLVDAQVAAGERIAGNAVAGIGLSLSPRRNIVRGVNLHSDSLSDKQRAERDAGILVENYADQIYSGRGQQVVNGLKNGSAALNSQLSAVWAAVEKDFVGTPSTQTRPQAIDAAAAMLSVFAKNTGHHENVGYYQAAANRLKKDQLTPYLLTP